MILRLKLFRRQLVNRAGLQRRIRRGGCCGHCSAAKGDTKAKVKGSERVHPQQSVVGQVRVALKALLAPNSFYRSELGAHVG
jgi:hypothetical protein